MTDHSSPDPALRSEDAPINSNHTNSHSQNSPRQMLNSKLPHFSFVPLILWPFSLTAAIIFGITSKILGLFGISKNATSGNFTGYAPAPNNPSEIEGGEVSEELCNANSAAKWLIKNAGDSHPPIFMGEYSEALAAARRGFRYLLVVLVSEIQDDASSLLEILKEQELIDYINTNQVIFWIGSVLDTSGMQVAETLMAGLLPLFALAAPKFDPGSSNFRLSIIARMDGILTTSALPTNSPKSKFLTDWMALPISRHNNIIQSARREQEERDRARELRVQQDAAYTASLERDRVRENEQRIQREEQLQKEIRRNERQAQKDLLEKQKQDWRLHILNKYFKAPEPIGSPSDGVCILSIRLEDGTRVKRRFSGNEPTERIYMFVETLRLKEDGAQSKLPTGNTPNSEHDLDANNGNLLPNSLENYTHKYDFSVMSSFPKTEVTPNNEPIYDFLTRTKNWPSVALVVESLESGDLSSSEGEG